MSYRYPRTRRITTTRRFRVVLAAKCSASDEHLIVYAARNDLPFPRLGVVVRTKHGDAVRRNRFKRLIREAFRLSQEHLPAGHDFVVLPRGAAPPSLRAFSASLPSLAARAARRASARSTHG